jgi:hypothetical protein
VEKISRLRLSDPVASGVKCGPHGGMNSKMKLLTVSWFSLKTKVEPGLRGSQVIVAIGGGYTEFAGFPVVHRSLVDPQSQDRRTEDKDAAAPDRSDRWV